MVAHLVEEEVGVVSKWRLPRHTELPCGSSPAGTDVHGWGDEACRNVLRHPQCCSSRKAQILLAAGGKRKGQLGVGIGVVPREGLTHGIHAELPPVPGPVGGGVQDKDVERGEEPHVLVGASLRNRGGSSSTLSPRAAGGRGSGHGSGPSVSPLLPASPPALPAVPVVEAVYGACLLLIPETREILEGAGEAEDVLGHLRQQRGIWWEGGHEGALGCLIPCVAPPARVPRQHQGGMHTSPLFPLPSTRGPWDKQTSQNSPAVRGALEISGKHPGSAHSGRHVEVR